jgi:hypothetical protein
MASPSQEEMEARERQAQADEDCGLAALKEALREAAEAAKKERRQR